MCTLECPVICLVVYGFNTPYRLWHAAADYGTRTRTRDSRQRELFFIFPGEGNKHIDLFEFKEPTAGFEPGFPGKRKTITD